jgi:hypothetical protein
VEESSENVASQPSAEPRSAWRAVAWRPVGAVVFIALLFLGAALWILTENVEDIKLSWEFPKRIFAGEEFRFEYEIHNTADAPQLLTVIEIDEAFLRQITVLGTKPGFKKSEVNFLKMRIYTFNTPIPPGDVLRIEVRAMPKTAGEFRADFGFCVTSKFRCFYWNRTIYVEETDRVRASAGG